MGTLRPWARFLLLVAAHLLALGIGAAVLQALEGPPALQLQAKLRAELAAFQAEYGACLPPGALEELLGTALEAQVHGVSSLGNGSEARTWDLPSALLFTASILTTTGKAARQPGRRGSWGHWGCSPSARPKMPDSPGLTRPDVTAGASHPNTPTGASTSAARWGVPSSVTPSCLPPRPRKDAQTLWPEAR